MNEAIKIIFGGRSGGYYLGNGFFIILAIAISLLILVLRRDKTSRNTPTSFSWRFLLVDNIVRAIITLMAGFLLLRFAPIWLPTAWMIIGGFGLTFGFDQLVALIINSGDTLPSVLQKILEYNRQKFMAKNTDPSNTANEKL